MVLPQEDTKLIETIRQLQAEVTQLRKRGSIPRLDEDPDEASGITLWMLHDGRLRGRLRTGVVQEWAKVDHTHPGVSATTTTPSPVSTVPAPPPPYTPAMHRYEGNADWSGSYWQGGAELYPRADTDLYYGMYTASTGEHMSMIHFPGLDVLQPGPAGTRIAEVWLRLSNLHTTSHAGGILYLGLHNSDTKPTSFQETERPPFQIEVGKPSPSQWYQLPEWVGERIRDGQAKGITLHQNSTSRSLYGYASGVGGALEPPQLRIDYIE